MCLFQIVQSMCKQMKLYKAGACQVLLTDG